MLFILFALVIIPNVKADWNVEKITKEMQGNIDDWTIDDTLQILEKARAGLYSETRGTYKGKVIIQITGETFLLNGKDISGNLGSKITHGDNSPIIEDIEDSQIAIGNQAKASEKNTNFNLNIVLSFAFTISFAFNIYFYKKLKYLTNKSSEREPSPPKSSGYSSRL